MSGVAEIAVVDTSSSVDVSNTIPSSQESLNRYSDMGLFEKTTPAITLDHHINGQCKLYAPSASLQYSSDDGTPIRIFAALWTKFRSVGELNLSFCDQMGDQVFMGAIYIEGQLMPAFVLLLDIDDSMRWLFPKAGVPKAQPAAVAWALSNFDDFCEEYLVRHPNSSQKKHFHTFLTLQSGVKEFVEHLGSKKNDEAYDSIFKLRTPEGISNSDGARLTHSQKLVKKPEVEQIIDLDSDSAHSRPVRHLASASCRPAASGVDGINIIDGARKRLATSTAADRSNEILSVKTKKSKLTRGSRGKKCEQKTVPLEIKIKSGSKIARDDTTDVTARTLKATTSTFQVDGTVQQSTFQKPMVHKNVGGTLHSADFNVLQTYQEGASFVMQLLNDGQNLEERKSLQRMKETEQAHNHRLQIQTNDMLTDPANHSGAHGIPFASKEGRALVASLGVSTFAGSAPSITYSTERDLNKAWEVAVATEDAKFQLNEFGAKSASDLSELDQEDIDQLANIMKKVEKKKFLRFMGF